MQFPFGSRSLLHAFIVGNLCFACFASQTLGLWSAIPSAPLKFVSRLSLCCIVLYSVIFCFACFASQTSDLGSAFPSAPVKSVTRFCYAENFVLRVLPKKHRVCAVLLPRLPSSFFYMLEFILLYSAIFCFACFASPTSGLCIAFPLAPLKFTPFWFSLFYSVCFCYACFAWQAPVCAVISLRLASNSVHALFFALFYSVLSLCSAFFPSLI